MAATYQFNTILIPMQVSAFLNPTDRNEQFFNPPRPNRAYLAAFPRAGGQRNADDTDDLFTHDIFDNGRKPPYRSFGDRGRFQNRPSNRRAGVHLHWSLPQLYRTALAATATGTNVADRKRNAGYPVGASAKQGQAADASESQPSFRPVPDRYIVSRLVSAGTSGKVMIRQRDDTKPLGWNQQEWTPPAVGVTLDQTFIVHSSTLRPASQFDSWEDPEGKSTVTLDFSQPGDQTPHYLGTSLPMSTFKNNTYIIDNAKKVSPLTIIRTADPFFADYAPSNASVFSMIDDLSVPGMVQWYLSDATISYTVVGWHSDGSLDPLANLGTQSLSDRLKACGLDISQQMLTDTQRTRLTANPANALCVGQFNNIVWSQYLKPPVTEDPPVDPAYAITDIPLVNPADRIQAALIDSHPVAVGTNIVDALVAYVKAQPESVSKSSDLQALLKRLVTFVMDLNTDSVDSQLEAEDLLSTNNFLPSGQGTRWTFQIRSAGDTSSGSETNSFTQIPDSEVANLVMLNAAQYNADCVARDIKVLQQQLFDQYWIYSVDLPKYKNQSSMSGWIQTLRTRVTAIKSWISSNKAMLNYYTNQIRQYSTSTVTYTYPLKSKVSDAFFMQNDPTVMIAGAGSQYTKDPISNLPVRLDGSNMYTIGTSLKQDIDTQLGGMYFALPSPTMPFREIVTDPIVSNRIGSIGPAVVRALAEGAYAQNGYDWRSQPYYGAEKFTQNGFFPLFLEYEVEFVNIPFDKWTFQPCGPESRVGYCVKEGTDLEALRLIGDHRVLKGRSTILPHASSALKVALNQVFTKMNPRELAAILSQSDKQNLLDSVSGLDYLSTTLAGLTNQLLTRERGTHMLPVAYVNGTAQPTASATATGAVLGISTQDWLDLAAADSSVMETTPFASLTPISADAGSYSPFKPVTHGQFRFTKLNVTDRWGQVIQAIRTSYDSSTGWTKNALFPCLGEAYSLSPLSTSQPNVANAVLRRNDSLCSFVQLPPSISQPARINAEYITPWSVDYTVQRAVEDFENPVHGWLLLNYANVSLQIFTANGEFVREYSAVDGQVSTRPFAGNTVVPGETNSLLAQLLTQLSNELYPLALFKTLTRAVQSIEASPSHYAESMLSQLGRPIALVTFGVSLQLQDRPRGNCSTLAPTNSALDKDVSSYSFPVKIGDRDNVFDGLYGYFASSQDSTKQPQYDLSKLYSYHNENVERQPSYQNLTPWWGNTDGLAPDGRGSNPWLQHGKRSKCFAALVDPFTPLHVYSALLPVKVLRLSQSAVQHGLGRIRSFFKAGPVLSPALVPAFDATKTIRRDIVLGDSATVPPTTGNLQIPAAGMAEWLWLQPFSVRDARDPNRMVEKTEYNAMGVQELDVSPRAGQAPYQVVEGWLWMRKSFSAAGAGVEERDVDTRVV